MYTTHEFLQRTQLELNQLRRLHVRGWIGAEPYTEHDVDKAGRLIKRLGKSRQCPVCEHSDDAEWHRCCTTCEATATGEGEVKEVFGFYKKKDGPRRAQSACRTCRNEGKRTRKAEPVKAAIAIVEPLPVAASSNRRTWNEDTVEMHRDGTDTIRFGPIELEVITRNTPDGAANVPAIDPDFVFDTTEKIVIANALANAENTWIWGPSGAGKTSGVTQMCALLNWPLYRLPMSGGMGVAEMVGDTVIEIDDSGNAVTAHVDGLLIRALVNGGVLLIDEITATPPHILLELQQVLERSVDPHADWKKGRPHVRYFCKQTGDLVEAHPRFRIIATDNTAGTGDVTGAYAGTYAMNDAFRSRFTQWYRKGYPAKDDWVDLLRAKCDVSEQVAADIVEVAQDCNRVSSLLPDTIACDVSFAINPRDTLALARHAVVYGDLGVAFSVGYLDRLETADREFLLDVLRNQGVIR